MNFCKEQIKQSVTHGLFLASGSESVTELVAGSGFDWLLFDLEHGLGDEAALLKQLRAAKSANEHCVPLVRIPAFRPEYIKRVLDLGASGVMAPMIRNVEDACAFVESMRYPPEGIRGLSSGCRAAGFGTEFNDYFAHANQNLLSIIQVECDSALTEIDAIAAIDGVDVLFIGHSDLSLNLGLYGDFEHERMLQAENAVLDAALKHGKTAGMLLKEGMSAGKYLKRGFRFLAHGTDLGLMRKSFARLAVDCRKD